MEKSIILANVSSMTTEQLFEEIKKGNVTLEELRNTGNLDAGKRTQIRSSLQQLDTIDDEAWERARYGNEMNLSDYITNFPAGKYLQDAKDKIKYLEDARRQSQVDKILILENIKKNPNSYYPKEIIDFLQNRTITNDELILCGIPQHIIDKLYNIKYPPLELGITPESIPEGFNEIYFWGIPGSGKTCALAAILSTAQKEGYLETALGPGFDYMTKLSNIFMQNVAILPGPTPLEETQYLPFTLQKPNGRFKRSISLIELSGEIFKCFLFDNAGIKLPSESHENTLNSLNRYLNGNNRKIHFFFIDYETKNNLDDDGYTQSNYLTSAAAYFNKPDNNFFNRTTDAIYIVLTKSDLLECQENERVARAKDYLNDDNYKSFINTIKDKCRANSINAGVLTVEPFSLGKVYFQQICEFDNSSSLRIIDIMFERIRENRKSILDVFNK
jgi:hypothetical protein